MKDLHPVSFVFGLVTGLLIMTFIAIGTVGIVLHKRAERGMGYGWQTKGEYKKFSNKNDWHDWNEGENASADYEESAAAAQ